MIERRAFPMVILGMALLAATAARADILIRNVTLYDGTGAPALKNASVLVKGERIAAVSARPLSAAGARTIDGKGKFLIPGLMDTHIHLRGGQGGSVMQGTDRKPIVDREAGVTALHGYLYSGVTSVYDSGNNPAFIYPLREEERAGTLTSPHIFAAGGTISVPKGYGAGPTALKIESWEQGQKALDEKFKEKPDMLKLILDRQGMYANKAVPTLSDEMFKRIVEYAAEHGFRTTVHISAEWDAETAVRAGVSALAHPVLRAAANESFFKLLAERKVPVSTTMTVFAAIARVADDPSFFDEPLFKATVTAEELEKQKTEERSRYMESGMSAMFKLMQPYARANIKKMHEAGVILALGTDRTLGPMTHMELELLAQSGISPFDCIKIATLNGAIYLGRAADMGSIENGKIADLVLLKADPAADIRNFRAIDTVIKGGRTIDLAALDLPVNRPENRKAR